MNLNVIRLKLVTLAILFFVAVAATGDEVLGVSPIPSPQIRAYPADRSVTLVWDGSNRWIDLSGKLRNIEDYVDAGNPNRVFEGYRVYRKLSLSNQNKGSEGDWQLIAEYDEISFTRSLVSAAHVGKISNDVSIAVLRGQPKKSNSLAESTFLIKFLTTQQFEVIDLAKSQVLKYGQHHGDDGFTLLKDLTSFTPSPDGLYVSGAIIHFAGMYFKIEGSPQPNDIFKITTSPSGAIGKNQGLRYHYIDTDLFNGMEYLYCVTAYDSGEPRLGLPPLESHRDQATVEVVPRTYPEGYQFPRTNVTHIGTSHGIVRVIPIEPNRITGHTYEITFYDGLWTLTDRDEGIILLEDQLQSNRTVIVQGLMIKVDGPQPDIVGEEMNGGSGHGIIGSQGRVADGRNANHHDYQLRFLNKMEKGINYDSSNSEEVTGTNRPPLLAYSKVPFELWDMTDNMRVWPVYADQNSNRSWGFDERIIFTSIPYYQLDKSGIPQTGRDGNPIINDFFAQIDKNKEKSDEPDLINKPETSYRVEHEWRYYTHFTSVPKPGDIWRFNSTKPNTTGDLFLIETQAQSFNFDQHNLDRINVFPNPYYVTNRLVASLDTDQIFFSHLPPKCKIQIYTLAGELVRELNHQSDLLTKTSMPDQSGGMKAFNLMTYDGRPLANGMYVYHVESLNADGSNLGYKIGRFAIIR